MRKYLVWVVMVLSVFTSVGPSHVALAWDGYCDGNTPVFTTPPVVKGWTAECVDGEIIVTLPPPSDGKRPDPNFQYPPDFYAWANIYINNKLAVNPYPEVDAYIVKSTGRTLVPIRFITEALGGRAEWIGEEMKVRVSWQDKWMEMVVDQPSMMDGKPVLVGQSEVMANGHKMTLDQPPVILDGRTLVPLRAVVEAFGARVEYYAVEHDVYIDLEGAQCPASICDVF